MAPHAPSQQPRVSRKRRRGRARRARQQAQALTPAGVAAQRRADEAAEAARRQSHVRRHLRFGSEEDDSSFELAGGADGGGDEEEVEGGGDEAASESGREEERGGGGGGGAAVVRMTAAEFEAQNQRTMREKDNWCTPVTQIPVVSVRQANLTEKSVTTGSLTARRFHVLAMGKALKHLLTYEVVEDLLANDLLPKQLAQEWGALIKFAGKTVPFNMIYSTLGPEEKNPESKPPPRTDKWTVLGLLFAHKDGVSHFKSWYESGGEGLDFERDLILPLLSYYKEYREQYPDIKGVELGAGSLTTGETPTYQSAYARTEPEKTLEEFGEYPDLNIDEPEVESDAEPAAAARAVPVPRARTPSGAPIY